MNKPVSVSRLTPRKGNLFKADSVTFIQPRDEAQVVETGDVLGNITSELKPLEILYEFVSAGQNNYAYTIIDTRNDLNQKKTVCKFRVVTSKHNASQLVNFDVFQDMILNQEPYHTVTVNTEHKIK